MWYFLSAKFVNEDTLKWLGKNSTQNVESYDSVFPNYKKILLDMWNKMLQPTLSCRMKDWQQLCDKLKPYMGIFSDVTNKKQMIVLLNQHFYKLDNPHREIIESTKFNHTITIENNHPKRTLFYWVLPGKDCFVKDDWRRFELSPNESIELNVTIRANCELIIINDSLFEPIHIYELQICETTPIRHDVII